MASTPVHQPRDTEIEEIQELYSLLLFDKAPSLVVGRNSEEVPIPESVYNILLKVIGYMSEGKGVSVIPVMEELTTQQAANILGVSRPFLVGLLNRNEIPYHKTGTHRRIYLKDLLDYQNKRDQNRKRILDEMARNAVAGGDYDQVHAPDEAP